MAEVPSNLMEYFFNNIDVMREIAKDSHGRPISVEDAASLITSRFAFTSLEMLQQVSSTSKFCCLMAEHSKLRLF